MQPASYSCDLVERYLYGPDPCGCIRVWHGRGWELGRLLIEAWTEQMIQARLVLTANCFTRHTEL